LDKEINDLPESQQIKKLQEIKQYSKEKKESILNLIIPKQ
jgi:hypothetical protein